MDHGITVVTCRSALLLLIPVAKSLFQRSYPDLTTHRHYRFKNAVDQASMLRGGDRDPIFPVHATRESFAKVKHVYEIFGVPDRAQQEIFSGEHWFHGKQGLPFLAAALA